MERVLADGHGAGIRAVVMVRDLLVGMRGAFVDMDVRRTSRFERRPREPLEREDEGEARRPGERDRRQPAGADKKTGLARSPVFGVNRTGQRPPFCCATMR